VASAIGARRWVAVVDGSRTLAPRDWAAVGDSGRLWVVRPPDPDRGAWCADILLRSGAFSLVVLDGTPPLTRPVASRLTRLAQEHDVALVVAGEEGGVMGSAVRIRTTRSQVSGRTQDSGIEGQQLKERHPQAPGPRPQTPIALHRSLSASCFPFPAPQSRITLLVEKGGSHHPVEVCCAIPMARRLCAHPEVPDRRGVAKRNRQGQRVASPHRRTGTADKGQRAAETADHGEHETERHGSGHRPEEHPSFVGGTLPNKRRCAEPVITRDEFLLAR